MRQLAPFGAGHALKGNLIVQLTGAACLKWNTATPIDAAEAWLERFMCGWCNRAIKARGEFSARSRQQWGASPSSNFGPKYARRIT